MKQVLIIHGAYGNPEENWIPWLRERLEEQGIHVAVPTFPTPEGQTLEAWKQVMQQEDFAFGAETIVVGHSLGPAFLLHLLEEIETPIEAAYFVSPFYRTLGQPDFDHINSTFVDYNFDWARIKDCCKRFSIFDSDNDPYVQPEQGGELAELLGARHIRIPGAGHLNASAGYTEFSELLDSITL